MYPLTSALDCWWGIGYLTWDEMNNLRDAPLWQEARNYVGYSITGHNSVQPLYSTCQNTKPGTSARHVRATGKRSSAAGHTGSLKLLTALSIHNTFYLRWTQRLYAFAQKISRNIQVKGCVRPYKDQMHLTERQATYSFTLKLHGLADKNSQ
jgi:hypothetical protein